MRKSNVIAVPRNGYRVRRESVLKELEPKAPRRTQFLNDNAELPENVILFTGDGFYSVMNQTWQYITSATSYGLDGESKSVMLTRLCEDMGLDTDRIRYLRLSDARKLCGLVTVLA